MEKSERAAENFVTVKIHQFMLSLQVKLYAQTVVNCIYKILRSERNEAVSAHAVGTNVTQVCFEALQTDELN